MKQELRLSAGIMAIPKRANHVRNYLLPELQKQGIQAAVSWDTHQHNPYTPHLWYNARRAWECYTSDATHHLHLQDDAKLCNDFVKGIYKLLEAIPDQPISLFLSGRDEINRALKDGIHWMRCSYTCWGLATILPVNLIDEFLKWEMQHVVPYYKHDDGRLEMWCQSTERPIWLAIPMLVEHLGAMRSSLGQSMKCKVAAKFIRGSPLDIDWHIEEGRYHELKERVDRAYMERWLKPER